MPREYSPKEMEDRRAARLRWYYKNREKAARKHAEWIAANKAEQIAYSLAYDALHRDARRSKAAERYNSDREAALEIMRRSYLKHRAARRAYNKAWKAANPDASATYASRRRSLIKRAEGTHTTAEWRTILKAHGHRCAYCGVKQSREIPLTRDHYISLSKGGSNRASNIVPSCLPCNRKKSNRDPIAFERSLGRLI